MIGAISKCEHCGFEGEAPRLISIKGDVTGLTFSSLSGECPKCHKRMRILDGTFSTREDRLRIDAAPLETKEIIKRLNKLKLEAGEAGFLDVDEVLRASGLTNTKLAQPLAWVATRRGGAFVATILIAALGICKASTLDLNELLDQVAIMLHWVSPEDAKTLVELHKGSQDKEDTPRGDEPSIDAGGDDAVQTQPTRHQQPKQTRPQAKPHTRTHGTKEKTTLKKPGS